MRGLNSAPKQYVALLPRPTSDAETPPFASSPDPVIALFAAGKPAQARQAARKFVAAHTKNEVSARAYKALKAAATANDKAAFYVAGVALQQDLLAQKKTPRAISITLSGLATCATLEAADEHIARTKEHYARSDFRSTTSSLASAMASAMLSRVHMHLGLNELVSTIEYAIKQQETIAQQRMLPLVPTAETQPLFITAPEVRTVFQPAPQTFYAMPPAFDEMQAFAPLAPASIKDEPVQQTPMSPAMQPVRDAANQEPAAQSNHIYDYLRTANGFRVLDSTYRKSFVDRSSGRIVYLPHQVGQTRVSKRASKSDALVRGSTFLRSLQHLKK